MDPSGGAMGAPMRAPGHMRISDLLNESVEEHSYRRPAAAEDEVGDSGSASMEISDEEDEGEEDENGSASMEIPEDESDPGPSRYRHGRQTSGVPRKPMRHGWP